MAATTRPSAPRAELARSGQRRTTVRRSAALSRAGSHAWVSPAAFQAIAQVPSEVSKKVQWVASATFDATARRSRSVGSNCVSATAPA